MTDAELQHFVKEALSAGASKEDTEIVLIEAGWPRDQIAGALDTFAEVNFPVPVPIPKVHFSARDTFLYLIMFGMLYTSVYNLGGLLFEFVNIAFTDPPYGQHRGFSENQIRFSISALVVSFPVLLGIAWKISKQIAAEPVSRLSAVRKWLTYLTLAIASCIIAGDLIYLLYNFLSGELTVKFIFKALIVAFLSSAIFLYYLSEIREDDKAITR